MSLQQRLGLMCAVCAVGSVTARAGERGTDGYLDDSRARWEQVARRIWDTPELGLAEQKSSAALAELLEKEGFQVTRGVGGETTAFVATAETGAPVVALLAEYDALPSTTPYRG